MSSLAFAGSDSINAFEKSHPRDNIFCYSKNARLEVILRGEHKYTEPKERGYGEYLFYRAGENKPITLLELNKNRDDTLHFYLGKSSLCSKSLGYMVDKTTLAVLFQKENRPFKSKLVIQNFDINTLNAKNFVDTNLPVDSVEMTEKGFAFRTIDEKLELDIGKIAIEDANFIYQEKIFPRWIEYTLATGLKESRKLTFERLPWKKYFKDQAEFEKESEWNEETQKHAKNIVFIAVNHGLKKECFLMVASKEKITGKESWRCQTM